METVTETQVPVTPIQKTEDGREIHPPVKVEESLIERVSKFTGNNEESISTSVDKFNRNDIEKIQDPVARKFAEDAYKSLESGYQKKFQDLASQRKELESLRQRLESQTNQPWSPERVQQLLNDQTFVQAAQQVASTQKVSQQGTELSEEEFNYLTPEQQKVYLKNKQIEQTVGTVVSELNNIRLQSEHEKLKGKYANYDPDSVNKLRQDLMNGRYQATSEDIWKVHDYEAAIKRAYELGKSDRQLNLSEKQAATSISNGLNITSNEDVPVKGQNESFSEYWRRISKRNMERFMKK